MKITEKQLRILSGILFLGSIMIYFLTRKFHAHNPDDPDYGKLVGVGVAIIGLILLAPWVKDKEPL
jgi:hypothetical protein